MGETRGEVQAVVVVKALLSLNANKTANKQYVTVYQEVFKKLLY